VLVVNALLVNGANGRKGGFMPNNNGQCPAWIDTNRTDGDYIDKVEKALFIAWAALKHGFEGRTTKEPGMSVQARPLSKSEIQLSLADAMKKIEELI
jgi:hypothetical protein